MTFLRFEFEVSKKNGSPVINLVRLRSEAFITAPPDPSRVF